MTEVIDIGDRRELFVDNLLIDRMERTSLRLHEPVSGGVAIEIDRPWEGPANGRYLLYYRGMTARRRPTQRSALCGHQRRWCDVDETGSGSGGV